MLDILWSLAAFIVTLGILVTIHEFGHFWVARRCGVQVLTFSVGFGKPLWQRQAADGTYYQIGAIPLGGYVRMLDSRVDDVSAADYPLSFNAQSVKKRAAIVAAGPLANFILAIVVLWAMFIIGVPSVKPIIGSISESSVAARAGVTVGSEIIAINDNTTEDWQQVNLAFAGAVGAQTVSVTVRDANQREQAYQFDISDWRIGQQQQPTFVDLGLLPYRPQATTELVEIAENSPAAAAGLQVGDKIIAIDGTLVTEWSQIRDVIIANPQRTMDFELQRGQQTLMQQVTLGSQEGSDGQRGFLGVVPYVEPYPEQYQFEQRYGLVESLQKGTERTWELMVLSVKMIGKLLTGIVSVNQLSGPVAIAEGAGASASYGLVYFLGFLALISVNLGIINLLPLPILDGGHLVFLTIEGIRRRAVSDRVQEICYRIGGLLIFALMAIAISNDVLRLTQ
ncbi:MAG: Regulator of sigma-E protease RseP [Pseudidiomarina mangrovi]|nr:MAG: Regulator of sigma-E protease RseP [Pseudidiomarina mangrovi]